MATREHDKKHRRITQPINQFLEDSPLLHTLLQSRTKRDVARIPDEVIYTDGSAYFTALIDTINQATESILLETYIFQKDILGQRICQALINAAQRGVDIRILVDGCGSPYWGAQFAKQLERAGAQSRIYHPFPWSIWNWSRSVVKLPLLLKWIYFVLKMHKRNHRKVCIIDQKIAFVGSLNVTKDHLNHRDGGNNWRDTGIRLSNTHFDDLTEAFECAWTHRTIKERIKDTFSSIRKDPIIRLNNSRHRRRILYKHLLRRIHQAKKRLWITNAYFMPDNFLLRQLKQAAMRGVDVRILLPHKSGNLLPIPWTSTAFYTSLLQAGARIFEYLPSVLHAKSFIIDNWMIVGSSNLDHLSLLHNLEIDVRLTHQHSKDHVISQFLIDLDNSKELRLDNLKQHCPFYKRIFGQLMLYMKYWI